MPRRIRARTLSELLTCYVNEFPDEVARELADTDSQEAAELLSLLASRTTWRLLGLLDQRVAAEWLSLCSEPVLRRILEERAPSSLENLWPVLDQSAKRRISSMLEQQAAAKRTLGSLESGR